MTVVTYMWPVPSLPGYEEVRNFYARMEESLPGRPAWAEWAR